MASRVCWSQLRQRLEGAQRVGSPGRMLLTALSRLDVEACGVVMQGRVQKCFDKITVDMGVD